MKLPTISSYGGYNSRGYGSHTLRVDIGLLTLWYSYETIVAFRAHYRERYVSENIYSSTTGKHLNWIDGGDKKSRLPREEFEKKLQEALKALGLED